MGRKGRVAGRRSAGMHRTVTNPANVVVQFTLGLPWVKNVGLLEIKKAKGATHSEPRLIIREATTEVLFVKVIAKGRVQRLRVSTTDAEQTTVALCEKFVT